MQPPRYHGIQNIQNFRKLLCPDPHYSSNCPNSCLLCVKNSSCLPYNGTVHDPSRRDVRCFHHSPKVLSSGSYSVLEAKSLKHRFKHWEELRKNKLTASTFGGAIGFWRGRRIQLWVEKLGVIKPFSGNLATCWSNIKEEVALEKYILITRNSILIPKKFQLYDTNNADDDWLAASPDGLVDCPSGGILEIKCPFFGGEAAKASPWSRIPLHYMPQAQGLMEILDRNWMHFYCWTPNGSTLFRVNRDRQYWKLLRSALSDFWWKHVQPAMEFCRTNPIQDPILQMKSLKPAPKHELYPDIVYASKHLVDDSKLLAREIHGKLQN